MLCLLDVLFVFSLSLSIHPTPFMTVVLTFSTQELFASHSSIPERLSRRDLSHVSLSLGTFHSCFALRFGV